MARNKHPRETIDRILDAALGLFVEKGYERTTIQDIVDALGNLSKGAIYHHFKSKEEIIEAVADRLYAPANLRIKRLLERGDLTGRQKLRELLLLSLRNPAQSTLLKAAPGLMKNPRFFTDQVRQSIDELAPRYLQPILEQGAADGSLPVVRPRETAELLALLFNLWINPALFPCSAEALAGRYDLLGELLRSLGMGELLDGEILGLIEGYRSMLE